MRFLYNVMLHACSPIVLWIAYKHCHKHPQFSLENCWKKRRSINADLQTGGIWIHAASAGETRGTFPIINQLAKRYPDLPLTITSGSLNGAEQVSLFKADFSLQSTMLPLDYPVYVKRFLQQLQPKVLIVMETELWPNLYHYCNQYGIKIFLLNTRLTKRSYKRYRDFSLGRKLFQSIHWIGTQSEKNREQLIDLGVDANRVVAIGNIKALAMLDDKQKSAQTQWHSWREEHNFCWVAGSVHEGEVLDILNAHSSLMKIEKIKPLLIMTPRKPEEFSEIILMVKGFCVEQKWKVKILSEESHPISNMEEFDILIVDQMGHLSQIYAIADVAFVGGSLIPYGGHNILEPAMYSIPIISGPYHYDQIPIYSVFLANDAVIICKDSEDLTQALNNTLDKTFVKKISQQINKSVDDIQASIDKNLQSFYAQLEDILN